MQGASLDQLQLQLRPSFLFIFFLSICCSSHLCFSYDKAPNYSFMRDAKAAPPVAYYDYIIVGGGTAGCPLAATLSERSRVLLLERGSAPYGNPNVTHLAGFAATLADNSPGSPSQRFVSEDGVISARPRVLGGGSAINAGFYTRAGSDYVRAAGWDAAAAEAAYRWVEKVVAFEPEVKGWQAALRDGLCDVGVKPDNGFTFDHIGGTKVGGTIFDREGRRHTAADLLEYARPEGITVLLRARVAKILFSTKGRSAKPSARGVLFHDSAGRPHRAYLNKQGPIGKNEVILAAGALGSPQLLMLSGVGPSRHLKSLGVTVLLDQPAVGQGMADNPMNAVYVPSPTPVELSLIQVVGITEFGAYIEGASGSNWALHGHSAAVAGGAAAAGSSRTNNFRGGFILEKVMGPLSRGHLVLRSRSADDNPAVRFNYFQHPDDLRRCVKGIRMIERVINSTVFAKYTYPYISFEALLKMTAEFPVNLVPKHDNDSKSLAQFCRDTVMTIWHYHGGCQVGSVVDGEHRVIGVDALRVIDGSTFNASPGTNPQATVMMLGRLMGVKIQNEREQIMK